MATKRRGNGEGSVYQRNDGRWVAAVTIDGKQKFVYAKTRPAAQRRLREAQRLHEDGLPVVTSRQSVTDYLTDWLKIVESSVRYATFIRYQEYVRLHIIPKIGRIRLAKLTPQQVQDMYAACLSAGLSAQSVRHLHTVFHRALRQAIQLDLVARNVTDRVEPPRAEKAEMQTYSAVQVRAFLDAARGDRLEALYVLAVTTGMRQGELLGLRWQDLDLERRVLQVQVAMQRTKDGLQLAAPKTNAARRKLILGKAAVDALRQHRAKQNAERLQVGERWPDWDLVFANGVGKPITAGHLLRRSYEPLLLRANLPRLRFHCLRHTAGTLLAEKGVSIKVIQETLGHTRSAVTLDYYVHATENMQKHAAQAMEDVLSGS